MNHEYKSYVYSCTYPIYINMPPTRARARVGGIHTRTHHFHGHIYTCTHATRRTHIHMHAHIHHTRTHAHRHTHALDAWMENTNFNLITIVYISNTCSLRQLAVYSYNYTSQWLVSQYITSFSNIITVVCMVYTLHKLAVGCADQRKYSIIMRMVWRL